MSFNCGTEKVGDELGVEGVVDMISRRRGAQAYFIAKTDKDAVNRGCTQSTTGVPCLQHSAASRRPRSIAVRIDVFLDKSSGAIAVRSMFLLCEAYGQDVGGTGGRSWCPVRRHFCGTIRPKFEGKVSFEESSRPNNCSAGVLGVKLVKLVK